VAARATGVAPIDRTAQSAVDKAPRRQSDLNI
jgi:hypothetical protein